MSKIDFEVADGRTDAELLAVMLENLGTIDGLTVYDAVEIERVLFAPDFAEPVHGDAPTLKPGECLGWTVYAHCRNGGVESVIDCPTESEAHIYGRILEAALIAEHGAANLARCIFH